MERKSKAKAIRVGILLIVLLGASIQYLIVKRAEGWVPDWEGRESVAIVLLVPKELSDEETELLAEIKAFAFEDEGKATFTALKYWFKREYARYDPRASFSPVYFKIVGPVSVEAHPPPVPRAGVQLSFSERYIKTTAFLDYYGVQRDRLSFEPRNAVFVSFYQESQADLFRGVHSVADRRSRSGFVFAPLTAEGVNSAIINVGHELLHLYGATDKYRGKECVFPQGFYAPLQDPRYPQTYAEVMAQGIPVESGRAEGDLELFADMRVGVETAFEIGWIDRSRRDRYYGGDASAGPKED